MIGLVALYALCLMSGFIVERRFSVGSLLERILIVFSVGAAQLIFSVQILSVLYWLSGFWLLFANGILLAFIYLIMLRWEVEETSRSWEILLLSTWEEIRTLGRNRMLLLSVIGVFLFIGFSWAFGLTFIPWGDGYHYDMPMFWRQHQSIMPFIAPNPRVIATSFASEVLCLPGYIYCQTDKMIAVLTLLPALLSIWLVYSIAHKLCCSFVSAVSSAIITVGYTVFALSFLDMKAEIYLAMMWSGACLLFLLDACPPGEPQYRLRNLGWSVFCFALACGTKNTCIISGPLFLICIAIVLRHSMLKKETWYRLILIGAIALVCSGVVWNYTSNILWFGNAKGPPFMQGHTSNDFHARSMWTRLARGSVMFLFDTTWIPDSKQQIYADWCAKSLKLLRAQEQLAEDDDFFGLKRKNMQPRLGFGLLGIFLFLPGLVLGLSRCIGIGWDTKSQANQVRLKIGLLVLMTIGSFVVPHIMLKSQSIGIVRILPLFLMAGAPLVAPLLERQTQRTVGLALLAICCALFVKLDSKYVQFWDVYRESTILQRIAHLSKNPEKEVEYTWDGFAPKRILTNDKNLFRDTIITFLSKIKQPSVIGFVGGANSELYYLFGKDFSNRIIPLTDIKSEGQFQEPANDIEYIVFSDYGSSPQKWTFNSGIDEWCLKHDYKPIYNATSGGKCFFKVFKK